jgi:glucose-1-phosphate adenylyltransferase
MGGISFLPPFIDGNAGMYKGHIDAIHNLRSYISKGQHEYVVLCDANTILNIDLKAMFKQHKKNGADITIAYKNGPLPAFESGHTLYGIEADGRINEVLISEEAGKICNYGISIGIFRRDLLLEMAKKATEQGIHSINRAIQLGIHNTSKIYGYKVENFIATIDGIKSYTDANMALLSRDVRRDLFNSERPIYTKTRDDMPTRYGLNSSVKNSIIGEGCIIEGEVLNCVLFRGVKVGKGSVVKNCILFQDTFTGENVKLNCVIADKNVVIRDNKVLSGDETLPFYLAKGKMI